MKLLEIIKRTVKALQGQKCNYCLIGGHAASLYRAQERLTKDVDFALSASPRSKSREVAQRTIQRIGFRPIIAFIPAGKKEARTKRICMVTSMPPPGELKGIIDILLPEVPWVTQAVERAQNNKIDLGFAKVPVITAEDLILAKCYALENSPDRFQDLDDLKQIFQSVGDLDVDYLRQRLDEIRIPIPKTIKKYAPRRLRE